MAIDLPFGMKTPAQQAGPPAPKSAFDPAATSGPQSFHPEQDMQAWQNTNDRSQYPKRNGLNPNTRPDLNNRVYNMVKSGAQWLPLQTLYGLADSGLSDSELLQLTEHMRRLTIEGVQGSALKPHMKPAQQGIEYQEHANKA